MSDLIGWDSQSDPEPHVDPVLLCDWEDGEIVGSALAVYEYDDGVPVGPPSFINPTTGAPYTVQGTLRPCDGSSVEPVDVESALVCADGDPAIRSVQHDAVGVETGEVFTGADGVVLTPTTWTPGGCPDASTPPAEYATVVRLVSAASYVIDATSDDLVSWTVRNKGAATLSATGWPAAITLDLDEVVSVSAPSEPGAFLADSVTVNATGGAARVVTVHRV